MCCKHECWVHLVASDFILYTFWFITTSVVTEGAGFGCVRRNRFKQVFFRPRNTDCSELKIILSIAFMNASSRYSVSIVELYSIHASVNIPRAETLFQYINPNPLCKTENFDYYLFQLNLCVVFVICSQSKDQEANDSHICLALLTLQTASSAICPKRTASIPAQTTGAAPAALSFQQSDVRTHIPV
jgi:hypothetical protein